MGRHLKDTFFTLIKFTASRFLVTIKNKRVVNVLNKKIDITKMINFYVKIPPFEIYLAFMARR